MRCNGRKWLQGSGVSLNKSLKCIPDDLTTRAIRASARIEPLWFTRIIYPDFLWTMARLDSSKVKRRLLLAASRQDSGKRQNKNNIRLERRFMHDHVESLQEHLKAGGIPTAVHYPVPLNEQPAYEHLCCPDCTPVAQQIAKQVMSLPMSPDLQAEDQDKIVSTLLA